MTFVNNTNVDIREFDSIIMEAINNDGIFSEELEDIFKLTKTPDGSAVDYALDFA